jgi:hypothetical protein
VRGNVPPGARLHADAATRVRCSSQALDMADVLQLDHPLPERPDPQFATKPFVVGSSVAEQARQHIVRDHLRLPVHGRSVTPVA